MADFFKYPAVDNIKSSDQLLAGRTSSGEVVRIPYSLVRRDIPENEIYYGGIYDYSDSGTVQPYVGGSGWMRLDNDAQGPFTNLTYKSSGINTVWQTSTNQLDFSGLKLGDSVEIRVDVTVDTSVVTQQFQGRLDLSIGGGNYQIPIFNEIFLAVDSYQIADSVNLYMGNEDTINLPAEIQFSSNGNADVTVQGWYIRVTRRG